MVYQEFSPHTDRLKDRLENDFGIDLAELLQDEDALPTLIKIFDTVCLAIKIVKDSEPHSRNFEIEIRDGRRGKDVWLISNEGVAHNLSDDLPKGLRVKAHDEFAQSGRTMYINTEQKDKQFFLLRYAHERAHALLEKEYYPTKQKIKNALRFGYLLIKSLRLSVKRIEKDGKSVTQIEGSVDNSVRKAVLLDIWNQTAVIEPAVWREALEYIKFLKGKGFNETHFFPEDPIAEEKIVGSFISLCELTHELGSLIQLMKNARNSE